MFSARVFRYAQVVAPTIGRAASFGVSRSLTVAARPAQSNSSRWLAFAGVASAATLALWSTKDNTIFAAEKVPFTGVPGTTKERTFIAIKPDGVNRALIGKIVARFERKGYKLVGIKILTPTKSFAEEHYDDLKKKPFFPGLVNYFSSGPVIAMVWEGHDVILGGRRLVGATNPADAAPGSVRGDYAVQVGRNIIHGSDSAESAQREIALWFKENEVSDWDSSLHKWVYEK